jgi:hypothetical protein
MMLLCATAALACQKDYCGDGRVSGNEQCESPNTENNYHCLQATEQCIGRQLATRDSFGSCDSDCGCVSDNFGAPSCVRGKCGAECSTDLDCDDNNPFTIDRCSEGCVCSYQLVHQNSPPTIISVPVTNLKDACSFPILYIYDADATDPDGDSLVYSLVEHPDGMTIDMITGLIVWQVSKSQSGSNFVTVKVTDEHGTYSTQRFAIEVGPTAQDLLPRRKIHVNTIRMDYQEYDVVKAGDQMWVDLNFENTGNCDSERGTIRITIESLGVSRKIGPFDFPARHDTMRKGVVIDIPEDAAPGVYSLRATINTCDGLHRIRHRDFVVVGQAA